MEKRALDILSGFPASSPAGGGGGGKGDGGGGGPGGGGGGGCAREEVNDAEFVKGGDDGEGGGEDGGSEGGGGGGGGGVLSHHLVESPAMRAKRGDQDLFATSKDTYQTTYKDAYNRGDEDEGPPLFLPTKKQKLGHVSAEGERDRGREGGGQRGRGGAPTLPLSPRGVISCRGVPGSSTQGGAAVVAGEAEGGAEWGAGAWAGGAPRGRVGGGAKRGDGGGGGCGWPYCPPSWGGLPAYLVDGAEGGGRGGNGVGERGWMGVVELVVYAAAHRAGAEGEEDDGGSGGGSGGGGVGRGLGERMGERIGAFDLSRKGNLKSQ